MRISVPEVQQIRALTDLGLQLKSWRRDRGLRIDDAAERFGMSVDMLSRIENGAGSVRTDKVLHALSMAGLQLFIAPQDHEEVNALIDKHALSPEEAIEMASAAKRKHIQEADDESATGDADKTS